MIDYEVRRNGPIIGFDRDDLKQEMRVVVARCLPRLNHTNTGKKYVRTSIRHALQNLKRAATTAGRLPQDSRGRGLKVWYLDAPRSGDEEIATHGDTLEAPGPTPEQRAGDRELLSHLDRHLTEDDRSLLTLFLEDAIKSRDDKARLSMLLSRASKILHRVASGTEGENETMTIKIPQTPKEELPSCHADGKEPMGYETDLSEAQDCQDCPDKFTCLPKAIEGKLIKADISIDPEVAAVYAEEITFDVAADRVARRQELREKGKAIPAALKYDNIPTSKAKTEETKTMTTKKKTSKKKAAKKTAKKKAAKKTAKKKAAKKTAKRTSKKAAKKTAKKKTAKKKAKKSASRGERPKGFSKGDVELMDDGRLKKWDGRFLPAPKEISKEKVEAHLADKIKLGLPFDLAIGMKLRMNRRDGSQVVIAITSKGYKVEKGIAGDGDYHPNGSVFSSLSAACMWTSPTFRTVSCNDVFNFEKHNNIEITGKGVPGKKFKKGDAA